MPALAPSQMTVDEFLDWSEKRDGRFELINGAPVKMEAERVRRLEIKSAALMALSQAIRRAKAPCQALPDGATVRISKHSAFRPDALVRCGARLPEAALEVPDPVIVVEVISPSTAARDYGDKVDGCFTVATVQHYLILVPHQRRIVHRRRGQGDVIERRLVVSGPFRLDAPGLEVVVDAMFGQP